MRHFINLINHIHCNPNSTSGNRTPHNITKLLHTNHPPSHVSFGGTLLPCKRGWGTCHMPRVDQVELCS